MAQPREATLALFKRADGDKAAFSGELEVLNDIPKGTKLKVRLYAETSSTNVAYFKGPAYIPQAMS